MQTIEEVKEHCRFVRQGMRFVAALSLIAACGAASARTFEFKHDKKNVESEGKNRIYTDKTTSQCFTIRVGSPTGRDSLDDIEIRAATMMKNIVTKKFKVNDIAKLSFKPDNKTSIKFSVESGEAKFTEDNWKDVGYDGSRGFTIGGVIIEMWQNGKCLKHWASYTGAMAKTQLDDNVKLAYLSKEGFESDADYFKNNTKIKQLTVAESVEVKDAAAPAVAKGMNWAALYRKDPKSLLEEQVKYSYVQQGELMFLEATGEVVPSGSFTPGCVLEFCRAKKMEEALKSKDATAIEKMAEAIIGDILLSQEQYQSEEKLVKLIRDCSASEAKFAISRVKIKKLADRINEIKTIRMKTWNPDGLKTSK